MKEKIVNPIGWLAGHEDDPVIVIDTIAVEMLGQRSDILARASKTKDVVEQALLEEEAHHLERYATALFSVYYQLAPAAWDPATNGGLLELAEKYRIALPGWMTPKVG